MKRPIVDFLTQLLFAARSRLTRRARLEAENLVLRQQLIILQRKCRRARLRNLDRLLLVWLYRLYPSLLDHHGAYGQVCHRLQRAKATITF
jgi:hypothetical protein